MSNDDRRLNSACERNRDLVLQMYREGSSMCQIAKLIRTKVQIVSAFLRRNGFGTDGQHFPKRMRKKERHHNWKGGRIVNKDGYIEVYSPDHPHRRKHTPYVLEHRLVMEQMIGRYLLPNEVVHHRDGNPQNNNPENLQLFSENSEHLAFELKGRCPNWTPEGLQKLKSIWHDPRPRRGRNRKSKEIPQP